MTESSTTIEPIEGSQPKSKAQWKTLGYRVPTQCLPEDFEYYSVPGYRTVLRERYLYAFDQVVKVDPEQAKVRTSAAQKATATRKQNMEHAIAHAELKI